MEHKEAGWWWRARISTHDPLPPKRVTYRVLYWVPTILQSTLLYSALDTGLFFRWNFCQIPPGFGTFAIFGEHLPAKLAAIPQSSTSGFPLLCAKIVRHLTTSTVGIHVMLNKWWNMVQGEICQQDIRSWASRQQKHNGGAQNESTTCNMQIKSKGTQNSTGKREMRAKNASAFG